MGDVLVESPVAFPKRPTTIAGVEHFDGVSSEIGDEYNTLKKLQRQLEYIQLQEEYIKDEQRYF